LKILKSQTKRPIVTREQKKRNIPLGWFDLNLGESPEPGQQINSSETLFQRWRREFVFGPGGKAVVFPEK
jgi:hypothetical protein